MKTMLALPFFCFLSMPSSMLAQEDKINFSVSPPLVEMKLKPNSLEKVTLTLFNQDGSELELIPKVTGLGMTPKGEAFPLETGIQAWSCAEWIGISEKKILLPPNQRNDVLIEIRTPGGVSGGRYAVVLFEAAKIGNLNDELKLIGRLGTVIMAEVSGGKKIAGEIQEFSNQKDGASLQFIVMIKNTGNIHFRGTGSVLILNSENKIIDRLPLNGGTGTVLPEMERQFTTTWSNEKKMAKGKYSAKVQFRIPGFGRILSQTAEFHL